MPIFLKTPLNDISKRIEEETEKRKKAIILRFNYLGEQCINQARNNGSYMDRTGNLRSSIGYAVLNNGQIIQQARCQPATAGSDKLTGTRKGDEFLQKVISKNKSGIVLIVTAGMNYAEVVESRGYDVLSSAELLAKRQVPLIMKKLGFKIKQ